MMEHESKVPVIGVDYFFITSGGMKTRSELDYLRGPEGEAQLEQDRRQGKVMKCIVLKCRQSKAVFAHAVPCKGMDENGYVVQLITEVVKWLGHVRLILKPDGENAKIGRAHV